MTTLVNIGWAEVIPSLCGIYIVNTETDGVSEPYISDDPSDIDASIEDAEEFDEDYEGFRMRVGMDADGNVYELDERTDAILAPINRPDR